MQNNNQANNPQFSFNIPVASITTNQNVKSDPYSFSSSIQFTPPQIDPNAVKNVTFSPLNLTTPTTTTPSIPV